VAVADAGPPGAVLLYALIWIVVFPRRPRHRTSGVQRRPPRTGAEATGGAGDLGRRVVRHGGDVVLPANHGPHGISDLLASAARSSPAWLARFQTSVAASLHGDGRTVALVLAVLSVVIGIGPLLVQRATPFLIMGTAVVIDFWIMGQSFGGIVAGIATDPNTGPLLVLLAVALFLKDGPRLRRPTAWPVPQPTQASDALSSGAPTLAPG
jgi:hypothetical protein